MRGGALRGYLRRRWAIAALAALVVVSQALILSYTTIDAPDKQETAQQASEGQQPCRERQRLAITIHSAERVACVFLFTNLRFIDRYHDTLNAVSTLAVAIFTATLWQTTKRLFRAGERQIEIASKSVDVALKSANVAERSLFDLERPYLFIDPPEFTPSAFAGRPPVLRYITRNYGRTPAILRWLEATVSFSEATMLPAEPKTNFLEVFNGILIFKDGEEKEVKLANHSIIAFPERYAPHTALISSPILTVHVQYFDVFGWVHYEGFRFFLSEGKFHAVSGERKSKRQKNDETWHPSWVSESDSTVT